MNTSSPSRLQSALARRIQALIQTGDLEPGSRLTELGLAERLKVSRTPVRAALAYLEAQGLVERQADRVLVVARAAGENGDLDLDSDVEDLDRLFVAVAADRLAGRLPTDVTEADLMRRYDATRRVLQSLLGRLSDLGLVARKPGNGWRFLPTIDDMQARAESYRFRLLLEPAALREPGYRADPGWLAGMRRRHDAMMAAPWQETSSIALFEMNAEFHEGLAAASGNRFLLAAVQQQNRLRRFVCYDWVYGRDRMIVSCVEHLEIIERLEQGDREIAAALLRRHLEKAAGLNRGLRPGARPTASAAAP